MSVITEKKEELEDIRTAKFITGTLRDISASKIQDIRDEFQQNRTFYAEIRDLYRLVKAVARKQERKGDGAETAQNETAKEKELLVAVTSNRRFYGTLNQDVMETFIEHAENSDADCMVIGETGQQYFRDSESSLYSRCETTTFANDDPTRKEMAAFLDTARSWDRVYVYYPRFVNIFEQETAVIDITHTPDIQEVEEVDIEPIFEPELSRMLQFFEDRIRYILFQRTMLETELARTAARLIKMNTAEERASELIDDKRRELHKEKTSLSNMHLLETFAGFLKWGKEEKR